MHFRNIFFHTKKNKIFRSWKKIVHSFDAEKAYLSIGGIFRAIWAFPEALEQILYFFFAICPWIDPAESVVIGLSWWFVVTKHLFQDSEHKLVVSWNISKDERKNPSERGERAVWSRFLFWQKRKPGGQGMSSPFKGGLPRVSESSLFVFFELEKNHRNFVPSYGIVLKIPPIESLGFFASKLYPKKK